jgi:hypothetical protein
MWADKNVCPTRQVSTPVNSAGFRGGCIDEIGCMAQNGWTTTGRFVGLRNRPAERHQRDASAALILGPALLSFVRAALSVKETNFQNDHIP